MASSESDGQIKISVLEIAQIDEDGDLRVARIVAVQRDGEDQPRTRQPQITQPGFEQTHVRRVVTVTQPSDGRDWEAELCGCCDSKDKNCGCIICTTAFCPLYCPIATTIMAKYEAKYAWSSALCCGASTFVPGLNIACLACLREEFRKENGIKGDFKSDCYVAMCCSFCALFQMLDESNQSG